MGKVKTGVSALIGQQGVLSAIFGVPEPGARVVKKTKPKQSKMVSTQAQADFYDMFVRHWDDPPSGYYQAKGCLCRVSVHGNTVYPEPCQDHESIAQADFEIPSDWLSRAAKAEQMRQAFFKLPWAEMPAWQVDALHRLFICWDVKNPAAYKAFGKPKDLQKDQVFTGDPPFDCGCTFIAKSIHVKGVWFQTRSWTKWVAVRVGDCKKGPGLCKCSNYPAYPLTVKIGLVLKKEWEKRNRV